MSRRNARNGTQKREQKTRWKDSILRKDGVHGGRGAKERDGGMSTCPGADVLSIENEGKAGSAA